MPSRPKHDAPAADAADVRRVRHLLAVSEGDPLAPFAMRPAGRPLWAQDRLSGVPTGRDVVVRGSDFTLTGRPFRNLRQAIQRSHNAGVEVEICREGDLMPYQVSELRALIRHSRREDSRGFSMILGRLFDGSAPNAVIAVARVSIAFAPFPDLFVNRSRLGVLATVAYGAVHLLDPLISVERLYRYLRKFHAFDQQRFVMLRWRQVAIVAVALLLLEFGG